MNLDRLTRVARCLLAFVAAATLATAADPAAFTPVIIKGHPAHPTRLLAKLKTGPSATAHASALAALGLRAARGYDLVPGLVMLDAEAPAQAMAAASAGTANPDAQAAVLEARLSALRASGLFEYVEPDFLFYADAVPTDSAFTNGTLWGLRNTGQNGGTPGVDIDVVRAWDVTTGSTTVIVGVIDTGIRYTHQDLTAQMWRNPGETAGNNRDDDGNGYIDDVFGINAVANNGNPLDDDGHGTHVAGTIGAAANNGQPHVGVAWNVRLMALKFLRADGGGDTADAIECINYAVAKGAHILNNSWGGGPRSQAMLSAISAARDHGVLFVAAAGNDGVDNDFVPHFPSSYDGDNVIAVASIDRYGYRASSSDYGVNSVDLGAPGVEIYSTVSTSDTSYATFQGTSMATPHVSGVAALIRARFPGISIADWRDRLLHTTTPTPGLQGSTVTGGRVNAYQALTATADGQMEIALSPRSRTTLFFGRATSIVARVSDLVGVTGATVTGTVAEGGSLTFLDNGVAPDAAANDSYYTGTLNVPAASAGFSELNLTINASAPGKTAAAAAVSYLLQAPPPNDFFADRITLSFTSGSVTTSNVGGTLEAGEPVIAGEQGGASLWWSWTAPASTSVTLDTIGSPFDTLLGVYTGGSVNALTEITSNDDIDGPNQPSKVTFAATAGVTYQIVVDGWEGKTGNITLNLKTTIPPANDNFVDRLLLVGSSASVTGTNINATREANEPSPTGANTGGSVWWTWTAPATGTATVIANSSSYPGHLVAVYLGSTLATLVRAPARGDRFSGGNSSGAPFLAEAGRTYQIMVAAANSGNEFPFTLSLSLTTGPANDRFADRVNVSGTAFTVTGSNVNATPEIAEPSHGSSAGGGSVWWTWTAPADGTATLSTVGSGFDTLLAVYTGASVSSLSLVAANDNFDYSNTSRVRFSASGGTTYQIAVDGFYSNSGAITLALSLVDPPANDLFANRSVLTGSAVNVSANDTGATREVGEPAQDSYSGGTTLWWSWTAPFTGTAVINTSEYYRPLAVFTGDSLTTLTLVPNSEYSSSFASRYRFHAVAGVVYQISADSYVAGATGAFTLSVTEVEAPGNDQFADRTVLVGSTVNLPASNLYATIEAGEPAVGASGGNGASVWWTWTAPADGTALLTATSPNRSILIAVFTGVSVSGLSRVRSTRAEDVAQGAFNFTATAGVTYQIAVDTYYGTAGDITLGLMLVNPPANDSFAGRVTLAGNSVHVAADNIGATPEAGEPYHDAAFAAASVWWTWTASTSGTVFMTTIGTGRLFSLSIYTGSSYQNLAGVGASREVTQLATRLSFSVVAGATYQIAVDTRDGAMGAFTLDIELHAPPANDSFASRTVVTGNSATVTASSGGATRESGEPNPDGYCGPGGTVWWTWTASANGALIVSSSASDVPTYLGIFTGASLSALNAVSWTNYTLPGGAVGRAFNVAAGTAYHFSVATDLGVVGHLALSLTFLEPPGNDAFAARVALTGSGVTGSGRTLGATIQPGESAVNDPNARASAWWVWTAPQTGTALITLSSSSYADFVSVFSGTTLATLVPLVNSSYSEQNRRFLWHVAAGTGYPIAINSYGTQSGVFDFTIQVTAGPVNDMFADRIAVSGASVQLTGSNVGGTIEAGEPNHYYSGNFSTVWWSWTAPVTGRAIIRGNSSFFGTVAVYTGASISSLQSVVAVREVGPILIFDAVAGTTYPIAVDGYYSVVGEIAFELFVVDRPVNDTFAAAALLTGATASGTGTNLGALLDSGEPSYIGNWYTHNLVWWSWTAPANGRAMVTGRRSSMQLLIGAYVGSDLNNLTAVASSNYNGGRADPSWLMFDAVAGTTYHLAVSGTSTEMGDVILDVTLVDPPANDAFAARTVLSGSSNVVDATTLGARTESGETMYQRLYEYPFASVWWTWTAPENGRAVVAVDGAEFRPILVVFTGSSLTGLSQVAASMGPAHVSFPFDVTAGTTYQIVVDGQSGTMGDFSLALALVQPPVNDRFANRTVLSGLPATASGTNHGAIGESGEPGYRYASPAASVWWAWTAPADGVVAVSTAGSDYDTLLAVYQGGSIDALTWIAQNDDDSHGVGGSSRVAFRVVAGSTYLIAVDGKAGATGRITLNLSAAGPPANDLFSDALLIGAEGSVVTGSNVDATTSPNEPALAGEFGSPTVWWSWQPTFTGSAIVSTAGSNFDTVLAVVSGDSYSGWGWLGSNDNDTSAGVTTSLLHVNVYAGVTYHIVVDGTNGATGEIRLQITTDAPHQTTVRVSANSNEVDSALTLTADVSGAGPYAYQWMLDGAGIPGATSAVLVIPSVQAFHAGRYSVRVLNAAGLSTSDPVTVAVTEPPPSGARLTNLSTRALDLTGDKVLIPGFVVQGPGTKKLLIRAVGPTLAAPPFGLPGTLPNPRMTLKRLDFSTAPPSYVDVATNDDWGTNANVAELVTRSAELGAFGLVDGSADAALLVELEPGQYSVIADDPAQQTGIAIVEFYDADDAASSSRLTNISNRGYVGAGDNIMIPGFVVSNEGPKTLLIRVIGPTLGLPPYNVPGVLADPTLSIYRHDFVNNRDDLILTNDDWSAGPGATRTRDVATQVLAFALPEGSKDAAFVVTLHPGVYTVHARGKDDSEGVALVEVYAVP